MKVERFVTGMISTNCYLAVNEETKQAVIVDPAECPGAIKDYIRSEGIKVEAIFLTHAHFDHTMGIDGFLELFDIPVYVHEEDEAMMNDASLNGSSDYTPGYTFSKARYLKGGEVLSYAGYDFKVLHTPGHTPGGVCLYLPEEGVLFSGDTLFAAGFGRVDFPGSSSREMRQSLRRLFTLPEETRVYPGHGESTTIGREKARHHLL